MRNFLYSFLGCIIISSFTLNAQNITTESVVNSNVLNENLYYDVLYKWGIISKKAGEVNLITQIDEPTQEFTSMLVGKSTPFFDKFYTVRDTLSGRMMMTTLEPIYYEKIAHEGGAFRRDSLKYYRDVPGTVSATATIDKISKKGEVSHGEKLMTATGITLDMLSAFYYMRFIDYDAMKPGESLLFNIFSGKKKEILRITYIEKTQITPEVLDNQPMDVYHISFTFTYADNNQKKSSDPIQAWIGVDDHRIPYMVTGRLPIGGIRCVLKSSNINP